MLRDLLSKVAETEPDAPNPRLRGRTYLIPFARVWDETVALIRALPRWELVSADERRGLIRAQARRRLLRFADDVTIWMSLDHNALTRVDMRLASRVAGANLGTQARRIARFLRRLDQRLGLP